MLKSQTLSNLALVDDIFRDKFIGIPYRILTIDNKKITIKQTQINGEPFTINTGSKLDLAKKRIDAVKIMLEKSILLSKKKIPTTTFQIVVWISDFPPYQYPFLHKEKLYVFCKDKNDGIPNFILFPEHTYEVFMIENKEDSDTFLNFDETKRLIQEHTVTKKIESFFFIGTDTQRFKQFNLRKELSKMFPENVFVHSINPDSTYSAYDPIYILNNYRYLLNLPGNSNWSLRLKYLFLVKDSIVIDVKATTINLTKKTSLPPYITAFEQIFFKNKNIDDYLIPIYLNFYEYNPSVTGYKETVDKLNRESFESLVTQLEEIVRLKKKPKKKFNSKVMKSKAIYKYIRNILPF